MSGDADFEAVEGFGVVLAPFEFIGDGEGEIPETEFDAILTKLGDDHPQVEIFSYTNFADGDPYTVFSVADAIEENTHGSGDIVTFATRVANPEWTEIINKVVEAFRAANPIIDKALATKPTNPSFFIVFDDITDDDDDEDEEEEDEE